MRILYIVTAFPRRPGDVITPWLIETITRLRDRGIEIEVLAPSYRGQRDHLHEGITVHRFRYAPRSVETLTHDQTAPDRLRESPAYGLLVPGYLVAGSIRAARLARTGRFDAIHCFWPMPHGLLAWVAGAASGIPIISTFFGVELTWVRRELPLLRPVVRAIIERSDAVTVISSHTEAEVRRLVPSASVHTIPFGAAIPGADASSRAENVSRDVTTGFELLFVGRLVERKGVSVLLKAIARLDPIHDISLVVVGDGPLKGRLQREANALGIAKNVVFTGFVSEDELVRRIRHADAFVLPAVEDEKGDVEGLGVVLLEAMQHDRPVIASDSGGIRDIVVDGVTGLLTKPGDIESLGSAIERLILDPGLREVLVKGAREHLDRHFSWDRIIHQLTNVYQSVVVGSDLYPPFETPDRRD